MLPYGMAEVTFYYPALPLFLAEFRHVLNLPEYSGA